MGIAFRGMGGWWRPIANECVCVREAGKVTQRRVE